MRVDGVAGSAEVAGDVGLAESVEHELEDRQLRIPQLEQARDGHPDHRRNQRPGPDRLGTAVLAGMPNSGP